jgi:bifunctional DNA-binding transcriptional regulator/antitoxin component of YhaV-PrlF toxin-antitoxin module
MASARKSTMSATVMLDKRQTTLPAEVCEAAGLKPSDQIDWHFEDGEIRGRKIAVVSPELLDVDDVDAITLLPRGAAITAQSIITAIRAVREER